ncbi:MAG: hypothetical protein AB8V49_01750 [Coxiella endosymbiont of Dermacentor nuttalli]
MFSHQLTFLSSNGLSSMGVSGSENVGYTCFPVAQSIVTTTNTELRVD